MSLMFRAFMHALNRGKHDGYDGICWTKFTPRKGPRNQDDKLLPTGNNME